MKKNLLLFLVSLFYIGAMAQSLQSDGDTFEIIESNGGNADVELHTDIHNTASSTINYTWEREILSMTDGWDVAVCDINTCYLPHIESKDFTLDGDEEGFFIMHAYPNGIPGSASIKLTTYDTANPDDKIELIYNFCVGISEGECFFLTSTTDLEARKAIKIAPNPTNSSIYISDNDIVSDLTIFNIIGREIRNFKVTPYAQYDLSDLRAGLYLARMTDKDGQIVKTLRVQKL